MTTVHDVAACIMGQIDGPVTAMKLQKLVYYAQAWSLAWDGKPLFDEPIEAWADGPVCMDLYKEHRGSFHVRSMSKGAPHLLSAEQLRTIKAVVAFYGRQDPEWLSQLTHREAPWSEAREGLPRRARSRETISIEAMKTYYGEQAKLLKTRKTFPPNYASSLDLIVNMPPDETEAFTQDSGMSLADAVRWLETGEDVPCVPSN